MESKGLGIKPLLDDAKKALLKICIQMGNIQQSMSCMEAIELMNNLIHKKDSQKVLLKFQTLLKLWSMTMGMMMNMGGMGQLLKCRNKV